MGFVFRLMTDTTIQNKDVEALFAVGAQYGYSRSRRHPSTGKYIFGVKNNVEIFDLDKTHDALQKALAFVNKLGTEGKTMLLISSKPESRQAIMSAHQKTQLPYVIGRWIGGTLTNFEMVQKRTQMLKDLREKQESGELEKYTKKERLMMRREADRLAGKFNGIVDMEKLPQAVFVVDPRQEETAVTEAHTLGIPVVALASSDCNVSAVAYPIPANDSNIKSINFFVDAVANAYSTGLQERSTKVPTKKEKIHK